jgi:hypothetical protein
LKQGNNFLSCLVRFKQNMTASGVYRMAGSNIFNTFYSTLAVFGFTRPWQRVLAVR